MRKLLLVCILLVTSWISTIAQEGDKKEQKKDVFDLDLDELLNVKTSIASKKAQTVAEAPSVVSVITAEEIKNMGARDISEVLNSVPGFETSMNIAGNILVGVRGVKDPRFSCKILMLLDGRPINGIFYGGSVFYPSELDLENIERIEIIRGPGSALYGRNAFSAVINLVSKSGKTEKGFKAKAEYGSFNTTNARLAYGFNKEDLQFHISGFLTKTDGTDAINPNTKSHWNIDQNNQIFNGNINYKNFRFSGAFKNSKVGVWSNGGEVREKIGYYTFEYNKELSSTTKIKAMLYGQNSHHIEDLEIFKPGTTVPFPAPLGFYVSPEFREYLYGALIETNIKLADNNDILFGIQSDLYGAKDAFIHSNLNLDTYIPYPGVGHDDQVLFEKGWVRDNGHEFNNISLYCQDSWQIVHDLGLTLGARYDHEKQIGNVINPRVGLVWSVTPKAYLKVMYGSAYRSANTSQLDQLSGFSLGTPDLKPEKIKTYEASFSYRFTKVITQINVFRNDITDMIYAEKKLSGDVSNSPPSKNLGSNISTGVEIENKFFITGKLSGYINYSYTKSDNKDLFKDGIERTYSSIDVSPHKLNAGINYSFLNYFNLNTNIIYRSEMQKFFTVDNTTKNYIVNSKDPVGDYAVVNATLRFAGLIPNVELSASAYNLLNQKYYSQEADSQIHVPEQGRRQLIVRASFKF